jgi:hypothetical protein
MSISPTTRQFGIRSFLRCRTSKRGFAASRRTDERRHAVTSRTMFIIFQSLKAAVIQIKILHLTLTHSFSVCAGDATAYASLKPCSLYRLGGCQCTRIRFSISTTTIVLWTGVSLAHRNASWQRIKVKRERPCGSISWLLFGAVSHVKNSAAVSPTYAPHPRITRDESRCARVSPLYKSSAIWLRPSQASLPYIPAALSSALLGRADLRRQ